MGAVSVDGCGNSWGRIADDTVHVVGYGLINGNFWLDAALNKWVGFLSIDVARFVAALVMMSYGW